MSSKRLAFFTLDFYIVLFLLICLGNSATAQSEAPYARVSIAHGGASEHLPFSSLSAFKAAIEMGPDYIETDVQLTSDGILICFHDLVLENRTNVRELFPDRYTDIEVDGERVKTWYVNDFSLEEIKTLDYGSWFGPEYSHERIVSFQELIDLSKGKVGLYPESKDADFYRSRGLDIDFALHAAFVRNNLHTPEGQIGTPVIIQSFNESSLQYLRQLNGTNYSLIQLVWPGQSYDYLSAEGLQHIATYADGVAPLLSMVLPPNADRIAASHNSGLWMHIWHSSSGFPAAGYTSKEYMAYLMDSLAIDGLMIHEPDQFPQR
ncbi:MAG: glycerophosphodiester phosphodiesterase family protein [Pseudohongiellaceae bacterium]